MASSSTQPSAANSLNALGARGESCLAAWIVIDFVSLSLANSLRLTILRGGMADVSAVRPAGVSRY